MVVVGGPQRLRSDAVAGHLIVCAGQRVRDSTVEQVSNPSVSFGVRTMSRLGQRRSEFVVRGWGFSTRRMTIPDHHRQKTVRQGKHGGSYRLNRELLSKLGCIQPFGIRYRIPQNQVRLQICSRGLRVTEFDSFDDGIGFE